MSVREVQTLCFMDDFLKKNDAKWITNIPCIQVFYENPAPQTGRISFKKKPPLKELCELLTALNPPYEDAAHMLFLNAEKELLGYHSITPITSTNFDQSIRNTFGIVVQSCTQHLVMCQLFATQKAMPTNQDIEIAYRILDMCCLVGIELLDVVLMNKTTQHHFSFADNGVLSEDYILEWYQQKVDKIPPLTLMLDRVFKQ